MYRWERTMSEGGFGLLHEREIPSFSSSLLDEIYRSIDEEGGSNLPREQGFHANLVGGKKHSKCCTKAGEVQIFHRIESVKTAAWRAKERETVQRRQFYPELDRKPPRRDCDFDHDTPFFSSTSSSSDSSSNGFSSSDTESVYSGVKNRASCSVPLPRPKPVRTSVAPHQDTTGAKAEFFPFQEQRKQPGFDGVDEGIINSKSRALKIYSNLKKMKQPISPGGKLASFINSLFAANNTPRKAKHSVMSAVPHSKEENLDGKFKSGDSSGSSSALSFSRSCLSKYSPTTREKLGNGSKRTVQFYPMSMDNRTCSEKSLHQELDKYEGEKIDKARSRPVLLPAAQNPEMKVHRKITNETRRNNQRMDRTIQDEETAREFLRNCRRNQKKMEKTTTITSRGNHWNIKNDDDVRDYEDDAASCTSSDLFELDHLSVLDNDMYCEDLPVYRTTRVGLII